MLDRENVINLRLRCVGAVLGVGTHYISERASAHVGNAAAKLLSRCVPAPYSAFVRTGIVIATYAYTYRTVDKNTKSAAEYLAS